MTDTRDNPINDAAGVDSLKPRDFEGYVVTNDNLPTKNTIQKIGSFSLLDREGSAHTFEKVANVAERTFVIFVRHFFCGNCQEYLRALSAAIKPGSLPQDTAIVVIGCGDPRLIDMYIDATGCKFPLYTDPERKIFDALGMVKTLQLGDKPWYIEKPLVVSIIASICQVLRYLPKGLALSSGHHWQVGGEFMFETMDGTRQVTWCHRMRSTRDHAQLSAIERVLKIESAA
ncbi:Thioredoxin-like protein AAED1 [Ceratocystis fimbriata CBS 114723]|uniref:Thioredoxin-like protein AAED1 n=1 Tax=Ceratocystis fimbriata CBS 114723 TaxID=1035309 RepID=A0A2C5W394_9PEZI|nr:Thioredoxin-like protein AAED1 [Ceratocystis fimbriata CBS 114723]